MYGRERSLRGDVYVRLQSLFGSVRSVRSVKDSNVRPYGEPWCGLIGVYFFVVSMLFNLEKVTFEHYNNNAIQPVA